MSIKLVSEEIRRFLKSSDPEVICIMGKWGVGKTFAWKEYLKNAAEVNEVSLKQYSYVSLFGMNSIDTVKATIFEETINIHQIDKVIDISTFKNTIQTILRALRRVTMFGRNIPKIKDYLPGLFLTVRNQIICIDDLERIGENLSVNEVLGLISFLKNERSCKIILLLNDEQLKDKNAEEFRNQLEKVIDVEMRFEPTAFEAAEIGVNKENDFSGKFASACIQLEIVNIRVIKKIERLLNRLQFLLKMHDQRIFESAMTSLILFGWSIYQPDIAPPINYLKEFVMYAHLFDDKKKESAQEEKWRLMISSLNYVKFDKFDGLILQAVQNGYFDSEEIELDAKQQDITLSLQDSDGSFNQAWQKYHNSFDCNDEEVLSELFTTYKKNILSISPSNADSTITFFRKFNKQKEADEMIKVYMTERIEDKKFYDPNQSMFLAIKDPLFKKEFEKKLATFKDTRNPKDILYNIAKNSGWNPEDIETLAKVSSDDYYNIFKEIHGDELRVIVSQGLKLEQYNISDTNMKIISERIRIALLRISKESPMNHARVASYGIQENISE